MAKALSEMSASELQKAHDRASDKSSALNSEMIAAGRGYEKPSETRTKTDDLARRVNEHEDYFRQIRDEIERRKRYHGSLKPIKPHRWT